MKHWLVCDKQAFINLVVHVIHNFFSKTIPCIHWNLVLTQFCFNFSLFFFNLFTEDSKALELAGAGSDELQETEDVKLAREELKVLHDEKHRTEKLRATVMKELEQARVKTRQIEEVHYLCFCILFVLWLCSFKNLISSCFERAIYWYKHYSGKIWILLGPIFVFNFFTGSWGPNFVDIFIWCMNWYYVS